MPTRPHTKGHRALRGKRAPGETTEVKRAPLPLDRLQIETKALRYLERFDATRLKLETVLTEFVTKRCRELGVDEAPHHKTVEDLLERYAQNGLIDDLRFGSSLGRTLSERGASRLQIQHRLAARGLSSEDIDHVLSGLAAEGRSELAAAEALVKKRKLGHLRPLAAQRHHFRQDLGVLARAGFDYETAMRALRVAPSRDDMDD